MDNGCVLSKDVPLSFCEALYGRVSSSRTCIDKDVEDEKQASCGIRGDCSSHGLCVVGPSGYACACDGNWTGHTCNLPLGYCEGSVVDLDGKCCISGVLDKAGRCCEGQKPVVDAHGYCCTSPLDACGICGGNATHVDVKGVCCNGALDAKSECCASSRVDRCGVCDGDGYSCFITVRGTYNTSVPLVDTVSAAADLEREDIVMLSSSLSASRRRRLDTEFYIGISGLNAITESSALDAISRAVTVASTGTRGMCGNGV